MVTRGYSWIFDSVGISLTELKSGKSCSSLSFPLMVKRIDEDLRDTAGCVNIIQATKS